MSHHVPLFFFPLHIISTLTLSYKNNIKIRVAVHPHLSCSLMELIYHCVYCMPHSSLFMLSQYKRQQSREVLRTVFVCHRVPFLIPQAPAMPGGAVCVGEGAGAKHAFVVFPAALKVAWGDGLRGSLFDSLNPGHPVMKHKRQSLLGLIAMKKEISVKVFVIMLYLEWKGFRGRGRWNRLTTLNKGEGSQLSNSLLVKCALENMMKNGWDYNTAHICFSSFLKAYFRLVTQVNRCGNMCKRLIYINKQNKLYMQLLCHLDFILYIRSAKHVHVHQC